VTVDDPERVIAEALRAQAARTPLPTAEATTVHTGPELGLAGSGYGLLSGNDLGLTLPPQPRESSTLASPTNKLAQARRVPVAAILLLAIALGLAAGAVVGLVTLL
jgi:hypothetical protein